MQTVSLGENLHGMSKTIFEREREKKKKNIMVKVNGELRRIFT